MGFQKKAYSFAAGAPFATEMVAATAKAVVLRTQPQQGQTSWRDPAQLRMTLFTSRDGWDSSVGWL